MFKEVDPKQDFIALEHEIIKFWKDNKIQDKYLNKNKTSSKRWSFLDGPITANNPMGVHHAWGRSLKDLWQRYYTMKGYKQRYQNGFDCQGLWVEVEVEKELGFKNKRDIEKYGIGKFVNKCKDRVLKYAKIMTEQSERLAEWMHWDDSYYTMSDANNYTIWHFLRVCYEKGWIYQGTDSVPWCPRCGTAISQHEMLTEEYKEITHDSIYFTLPLIDKKWKDTSLLIWTTTPWTIPANTAVAVDPKKEYVVVKHKNGKFVLLKTRAGNVLGKDYEKVRTLKGKELIGLQYEAPFNGLSGVKKSIGKYQHQIIASDDMILPVSEEEGTGLVHIAPGAGSEDFRLGKKNSVPVINVIDEEAKYLDCMDELAGKNAKDKPELIFDYLRKKDKGKFFLRIEPYTHRYPTCWRCKTELVWRNVAEWYIAMDKKDPKDDKTFRQQMIEVAKKIKWIPGWGLDRELDWLGNMHDWLISKKRYWGLALPIWKCNKCGNFEVIGSKEELKQKAVEGWDKFKEHSPHRPWVDEVKIKCQKCGRSMYRIPDVGNPWLDAGIVPFSTYIDPKTKKVSYLGDKKYWREWFPADFITECFPGQFKNWFYVLIAMSTALENTNSYKTLLGHALVRDEHGKEMHKSTGNAIWFDEAAEKMGVDVMRWVYARQNPVQNLNFGYTPAKDVLRRFVLTLWNTYSFFITYANIDKWKAKNNEKIPYNERSLLDKWILARLYQSIEKVDKYLLEYNSHKATEEIEEFVRDLSTWYLRRSRKRRDNAFYHTMYKVLISLSKIMGIFVPHMAESIYQNLRRNSDPGSVHLCDWPKLDGKYKNQKLLDQMQKVRQIVELVHSIRREKSIKVRQPLKKLQISNLPRRQAGVKFQNKDLIDIIVQEVNVKKVELVGIVKDDKKTITKKDYHVSVGLNIEITSELRKEGIFREVVRQIQFLRKKAGLKAQDKMKLFWKTNSSEIKEIILSNEKEILTKTLSTQISNQTAKNAKITKEVKIGEDKIYLAIN